MHSLRSGCRCVKRIVCDRSVANTAAPSRGNDHVEAFVNGEPITVQKGTTILQACHDAGVKIPHFCYHARLAIAGNCRMCLVEVERSPKPIASCAMTVAQGMKILTESPMAKKAREGILEFLLANHPLDCPICDQGGECDLQDLSVLFGNDRSRFTDIRYSGKRSVIDKNFGPLIKTSFTKCIHCTRCVRFANEVAGIPSLGTTGRGNDMQIGMYIDKLFLSELSGNVIDLCPVGALTSRPYAFTARPWEIRKVESVDVMDGVGSNIVVQSRCNLLLRILPRLNEQVNEEWISDKARFSYDGLSQQRLVSPMVRLKDTPLSDCEWHTALSFLAQEVNTRKSAACVVGDLTDCETIVAMKDLLDRAFKCSHMFLEERMFQNVRGGDRSTYAFSNTIAGIDNADLILLVNANPRFDAPLVNARIRKAWLHNQDFTVCSVGPQSLDLTYDCVHLGNCLGTLEQIANARHAKFNEILKRSQRPMVILSASNSVDHAAFDDIYDLTFKLSSLIQSQISDKDWRVFNLLHKNCNTVGALDLGCRVDLDCLYDLKPELLFLLNCDLSRVAPERLGEHCLVVYIGHHGETGAGMANVVLPGCSYTEKNATFVNTEGRVQMTRKAVTPPGIARDDWKIIRALSEFANCKLPYDDAVGITRRLIEANEMFAALNTIRTSVAARANLSEGRVGVRDENLKSVPFTVALKDLSQYWMTNAITRSSPVMCKCVKACQSALHSPQKHAASAKQP